MSEQLKAGAETVFEAGDKLPARDEGGFLPEDIDSLLEFLKDVEDRNAGIVQELDPEIITRNREKNWLMVEKLCLVLARRNPANKLPQKAELMPNQTYSIVGTGDWSQLPSPNQVLLSFQTDQNAHITGIKSYVPDSRGVIKERTITELSPNAAFFKTARAANQILQYFTMILDFVVAPKPTEDREIADDTITLAMVVGLLN